MPPTRRRPHLRLEQVRQAMEQQYLLAMLTAKVRAYRVPPANSQVRLAGLRRSLAMALGSWVWPT